MNGKGAIIESTLTWSATQDVVILNMPMKGAFNPLDCNRGKPLNTIRTQRLNTLYSFYIVLFGILITHVPTTLADLGQCYPDDDEEIIFEDELYATSGSSSAWAAWSEVPPVAIFIFIVIATVLFSFGFSWLVRNRLDKCCERCWGCGKAEDDDEEEYYATIDNKKSKPDPGKTEKKGDRGNTDIERQKTNISEEPDELTWDVKVTGFLRDMPDGASVNNLYTDSLRRKHSVSSCAIVNESDVENRTDDDNKNPVTAAKATETVVASTSGVQQKTPVTPTKQTGKTTTPASPGRPTTAKRTPTVSPSRPTTAKRTQSVSPSRPTTAKGTPTSPRPQTAKKPGTPVRPTTAQRVSRVTTDRPVTRGGRPPAINQPYSQQDSTNRSTPSPVSPTSARRREEQKKFDKAWNQQQDIKALNVNDDDYLQSNCKKKDGTQKQDDKETVQDSRPKTRQESRSPEREPSKPLIGVRRPGMAQQQFKTTGRMTKSLNRKESGIDTPSPQGQADNSANSSVTHTPKQGNTR